MPSWSAGRRPHPSRPGSRFRLRPAVRAADALAALWVAVWIALAILVGVDIARLRPISATLQSVGTALTQAGRGLQALSHLPLIGSAIGHIGRRILGTGTSASVTAGSTRGSIDQLSYLLPIAVALVPVVPVLAVYLPVRVQRWREYRAVKRALSGPGDSAGLERYLAQRAVNMLPFHQLQMISDDPWADLESGRLRHLAEAELQRLGLPPGYSLTPADEAAPIP